MKICDIEFDFKICVVVELQKVENVMVWDDCEVIVVYNLYSQNGEYLPG